MMTDSGVNDNNVARNAGEQLTETCVMCNRPNSKTCSGCQNLRYCSKECQTKNWKEHKVYCHPLILSENDDFGRHFIASRNIKAGSLVLMENVAVFGPRMSLSQLGTPSCLSCCVATRKECSKCGWSICSKLCQEVKFHEQNECGHFISKGVKYTSPSDVHDRDIQILRMILAKQTNPYLWEKLQTLQSEFTNSNDMSLSDLDLTQRGQDSIIKLSWVQDSTSLEEWMKMDRIIRINSFMIQTTMSKNENHMHGSFLFLKGSMFANSCSPNCFFGVSPAPHFKMSVRSAVDIKKGEVLTILYNSNSMFWGTAKRQMEIKESVGFSCRCKRCLDKTEMGSYMSAWNCSGCKNGLVLPESPLDEKSIWSCSSLSDCKFTLTSEHVQKLTTEIFERMGGWVSGPPTADFDPTKGPKILFKILEKYDGNALHENHWLLTEARRGIVRFLSNIVYDGGGTAELKEIYFEYSLKLLTIMRLVAPGISQQTASLKISLAVLALDKAEDEFELGKLSKDEFKRQIKTVYDWQTEALAYFVHDASQTPDLTTLGPEAQSLMGSIEYLKQKYNDLIL